MLPDSIPGALAVPAHTLVLGAGGVDWKRGLNNELR